MRFLSLALCALVFLSNAVIVRGDDVETVDIPSEEVEVEEEATEKEFIDGLSADERTALDAGAETHEFQANVDRLMDIIIGSLYSNRDIFLRELISNAADALDKIRFASLTNKELMGEGDDAELDIKIKADKDAKTVTITDKGIGMTRDDLVNNLGTIAKSGTTEFLEAAQSGGDTLSLIGQFGVGFYSVYLVADKVTVVSKRSGEDQYIWQSRADKTFTIAKDPRGNTLGEHGTQIILSLKEDAEEFLQEAELEKLVARYSQFIDFPMYLHTVKTESREVPDEDAVVDNEDEPKDEDDLEVSEEEDEDEEKKPKTKTITEEVEEWKRLNDVKAIWVRSASDIAEEEYNGFYQALTKDRTDPLAKVHFVAEGEITFRSLLFIPAKAPQGLYDNYNKGTEGLKLYVRRVFISDEFDDFLPSYLNFIRGVVDSDDLPLNVSRETLAQSRILKVMSGKLTRKVLELLRKMAAADADDDDDQDEDAAEADGEEVTKEHKYRQFWEHYGRSIKLGVLTDRKNKSKLTKLLRYDTSKSDYPIGLETYVDRMVEDQQKIYYVTCESLTKCENAPSIEKLLASDIEVIYMHEPLDEYVMQQMTEFDGVDFQSANKENLSLAGDERLVQHYTEEYEGLTVWLKETLGSKIEKAVVSNRLVSSPCSLVTAQYGWSGNMERIMKNQPLAEQQTFSYQTPKKTLEINPRHPIVAALNAQFASEDADSTRLQDTASLLYDTALLADGFVMDSPEDFSKIINRMVATSLGLDPDAPLLDDLEIPDEEEEEEDEEEEEATEEVAPEVAEE